MPNTKRLSTSVWYSVVVYEVCGDRRVPVASLVLFPCTVTLVQRPSTSTASQDGHEAWHGQEVIHQEPSVLQPRVRPAESCRHHILCRYDLPARPYVTGSLNPIN